MYRCSAFSIGAVPVIFLLKNFFTGLWPLVWQYGWAGGAVLALATFYFAAPAWLLPGLRKIVPWLALAITVYLVGLTIGVKDEKSRNDARNAEILGHEVDIGRAAREDAERSIPLVKPSGVSHHGLDRYDRND